MYAAQQHGAVFRFNATVTGVTRSQGQVTGVVLENGDAIAAAIVVNVAGPWSRTVNEMAAVLDDFNPSTRPLEQEVISLPAPPGFGPNEGLCVTDADFGTYFRTSGSGLLVGGMEAPCDELRWLDRPEDVRTSVSLPTWETQSYRLARRIPTAQVPHRPTGIVGVYDVTDDWIPIYDRTNLAGYYVAIGTSGHGFKQAPFVGSLMAALITACEAGHPHDEQAVVVPAPWSGHSVDLGHFSRLRKVSSQSAMN
jgi:sarcosine oxidase subunit beta